MSNPNTHQNRLDIGEIHEGFDNDRVLIPLSQRGNASVPQATEEARLILQRQPAASLTVSAVQRLQRTNTLRSAYAELRRKSTIQWRPQTVSFNDPLLVWDAPAHYLDSICIVGAHLGFGPISHLAGGLQSSLKCKLSMASRPLKDKYLPITWDCTGRSYFIGFLGGKLVWLLFRPNQRGAPGEPGPEHNSSLSSVRQRRFSLFWAGILQMLPGTTILLNDLYADCEDEESYSYATNYTEVRDADLTPHHLHLLQDAFVERYYQWTEEAPWREDDPFFLTSEPILVIFQHGQNLRIFNSDHESEQEASSFAREFNWPEIDLFTYAIATTLRTRLAERLEPTGILYETGVIFDSDDVETRQRLSVDDVLTMMEHGRFPEVYDEDGDFIDACVPVCPDDISDCGILVDLEQASVQARAPETEEHVPDCATYPLAFCKGFGNCQVSTHLEFYHDFVDRTNRYIENISETPSMLPAVLRGPHQLYNEIAHKTRMDDGLHDCQRGYVTAAMAGCSLDGARSSTTHTRCWEKCEKRFPPRTYSQRLQTTGEYIGLRSEPTVTIRVQLLPQDARNGRFIYEHIMRVGCEIYSERQTWSQLEDILVIFKPGVWPALVDGATRPVSAALEAIWEAQQEHRKPKWEEIELASFLERLLVYAQTGNARVIPYTLASAFGVQDSIAMTGFPTFSAVLNLLNGPTPGISKRYWPTRGLEGTAITCANATLRFYYGEGAAQTHTSMATLGLLLEHGLGGTADTGSRGDPARLLCNQLVDTLVKDMKAFVYDACGAEIVAAVGSRSADERNHGVRRRSHLEGWKGLPHPWDFGDAHEKLMLAIVKAPDGRPALSPSDPPEISAFNLAGLIVDCMNPDIGKRISPLFIKNGAFQTLAPVVWDVAQSEISDDPSQLALTLKHAVASALQLKRVHRLPWTTPPPNGGRGSGTRHVGITHWITVQHNSRGTQQTGTEANSSRSAQERQAARIASQALASSPTAPWLSTSGTLSAQRPLLSRRNHPQDLDLLHVLSFTGDGPFKARLAEIIAGFTLENPAHRVGLRVATIAVRLLPDISLSACEGHPELRRHHDPTSVTLQWFSWDSASRTNATSGLTDRRSWLSVFLAAWLFYLSTPSTDPLISSPAYPVFLKKLGAKKINSRLFVRLKLAKASHSIVLEKGGSFGRHWNVKSLTELDEYLGDIERYWEIGEVQEVVQHVLGQDGLDRLLASGDI